MSEFVKVSGKIARVWDNATTNGRPYKVVEFENGDRYSLWRKGDFEKVAKGDAISFDYSTTGKWKNIERIYSGSELLQEGPGNGPESSPTMNEYNGHGAGNGNGAGNERLDKMVKMSCLKSASNLFSGSKIPFEQRADKVIDMAKKFEQYIGDELLDDDTVVPLETGKTG